MITDTIINREHEASMAWSLHTWPAPLCGAPCLICKDPTTVKCCQLTSRTKHFSLLLSPCLGNPSGHSWARPQAFLWYPWHQNKCTAHGFRLLSTDRPSSSLFQTCKMCLFPFQVYLQHFTNIFKVK